MKCKHCLKKQKDRIARNQRARRRLARIGWKYRTIYADDELWMRLYNVKDAYLREIANDMHAKRTPKNGLQYLKYSMNWRHKPK